MSSRTAPADGALLEAARAGDATAWEALVERYDRALSVVCRAHRLSHPDAADVKQTTWLRALEHAGRLTAPDRFGAWLATVARRECLRVLRRSTRVRPCDGEVFERQPDGAASPDLRLLASEREAAVRAAVIALPPRDRRLLGLLYSDAEPSYTDISRRLGMPVGSIGPTRGRALERLRREAPVAQLAAAA